MHNPHRTQPQKHGADKAGGTDMLPAKAPKTQGRCNVHPPCGNRSAATSVGEFVHLVVVKIIELENEFIVLLSPLLQHFRRSIRRRTVETFPGCAHILFKFRSRTHIRNLYADGTKRIPQHTSAPENDSPGSFRPAGQNGRSSAGSPA